LCSSTLSGDLYESDNAFPIQTTDQFFSVAGGLTDTLELEYTREQLRADIISRLPPLTNVWQAGSQPAFFSIGNEQGTGQKAKYRFKIPDSKTNETYRIKWKEVTTYKDGGTPDIKRFSEDIQGTGHPTNFAYGVEHEMDVPKREGQTVVASVKVYIAPKPAPPAGSGGGGGGFAGGGFGGGFGGALGGDSGSGGFLAGGCGNCGSGGDSHGDDDGGDDEASFGVSLGGGADGGSVGTLSFAASQPSAGMHQASALQFFGNSTAAEIMPNSDGGIMQIKAPNALVTVISNSPNSYQLAFYHSADVGPKVGDLYQTNGTPYVVWTISNPNPGSTNTLQISETRDGQTVKQWNYAASSTNGNWSVSPLGGELAVHTSSTNWVDSMDNPHRMVTVVRSNAVGGVAYRSRTTYRQFIWGEAVVTNVVGSDAHPEVTVYTYHDSAPNVGGTAVPLKSVTHPNGSWEYHDPHDAQGRPTTVYSSYGDELLGNRWAARYTAYDYSPSVVSGSGDDGTVDPHSPRCVTEYAAGQPVSQRFTAYVSESETLEIQSAAPGAAWNATGNLITTNRLYTSGPNLYRLRGVFHPDGTGTLYDYIDNAAGTYTTNIITSGALNSAGDVTNGTRTVAVENAQGHPVSSTTFNVATGSASDGLLIRQTTYGNPDEFGRPQSVANLDGTTEWTLYSSCCGVVGSSIDRDGVTTTYLYDSAKRNLGYVRNGITHSNVLDAAGRSIRSVRVGTNGNVILLGTTGYDAAGHPAFQTNALSGVTSHADAVDEETGGRIVTTTQPDGGTRIEEHYLDGSLKRVTGTAVQPMAYGQGVDYLNGVPCAWSSQTNLNFDGSPTDEWTRTYTDPLGRTVRTEYAGTSAASQSFYNDQGQLERQVDPDGNTVWYEYNANGEVELTVVDEDKDGDKELGGPDRVTRTASDYLVLSSGSWNGIAVRRSRTWQRDDNGNEVLMGERWVSVNGLRSASVAFGATNQSITEYLGSGQRRTTNTAPDGTFTMAMYQAGRLQSVTRKDTGGGQLGATTNVYDAHGRVYQTIDARTGATSFIYNNADQVTSSTAQSLTTLTEYNTALRAWRITQPDGGKVTNVYYPHGLIQRTTGVRTYPVEYTYDSAGRMATMKTWTNYPTGNPAVTTWQYDGYRGWLRGKFAADPATGQAQTNTGVRYTYSDAGRLLTRTWTRTVDSQPLVTTYGYNGAGDLTSVDYSDDTPDVTYAYDRLGRQTGVTQDGGSALSRAFNDAGQLTGETYTAGPLAGLSVTNQYDSLKRRTNVALLAGVTRLTTNTYGYSATSGRLDMVGDGLGHSATYAYLANSPLVQSLVFKQGVNTRMTTTKSHDLLNRLTVIDSVPSAASKVRFQYSYNNAGQRVQANLITDGALSTWNYGYDALGQVTSGKRSANGDYFAGQQFEYGFDTIGNRKFAKTGGDATGATGLLRQSDYTVNALNQYTSRTVPGYVDVLGQASTLATVTVNHQRAERQGTYYREELAVTNTSAPLWLGVTNLAVLNQGTNPDRIATNTGNLFIPQTPESFAHDADGNLTNDGRWMLTWDAENRLVRMESHASAPTGSKRLLQFTYDAQGRRIEKVVSTNSGSGYVGQYTNRFVYDGWNLLASVAPGSTLLATYLWGSDLSGTMQGAGGVGGLLQMWSAELGTRNFVGYDGNGNVAVLVNAADGKESARYEYGPFGELLRATGPMALANPFRFSTKYQDDETDQLYYGYRFYNPTVGRWPSRDPIEERGGLNLYGMVGNNPVNAVDLFGLWKLGIHEQITEEALNGLACTPCCDKKKLLKGLKTGSKDPDIPDGLIWTGLFFLDVESGFFSDEYIKDSYGNWTSYRSHFGDLQWWHSMQSNEKTAQEIQEKMIGLAIQQANAFNANSQKDCERAGRLLGFALHTIEDSFSKAHTVRGADWSISRFQNYGQQDSHKHGEADKEKGSPEYQQAVNAVKKLLNLVICQKGNDAAIRQLLQNEVLKLSPAATVGGTEPGYQRGGSPPPVVPWGYGQGGALY
jgi:RHS repeat-associated protein